MVLKLSRANIFKLINLYHSYPLLWDTTNKSYRRKDLRDRAYEAIANEMVMLVDVVKKKIRNLRTTYTNERRKIFAKNSGGDEQYVTTLPWYSEMSFLDSAIVVRKNMDNSAEQLDEEESSLSETDEFQPTPFEQILELDVQPIPTRTKKRKRESENNQEDDDDGLHKLFKSANNLLSQLTQAEDEEEQCDESFIKLLKINLRYITDPDLKDELSQRIVSLIFEYKKKQRHLNS